MISFKYTIPPKFTESQLISVDITENIHNCSFLVVVVHFIDGNGAYGKKVLQVLCFQTVLEWDWGDFKVIYQISFFLIGFSLSFIFISDLSFGLLSASLLNVAVVVQWLKTLPLKLKELGSNTAGPIYINELFKNLHSIY